MEFDLGAAVADELLLVAFSTRLLFMAELRVARFKTKLNIYLRFGILDCNF